MRQARFYLTGLVDSSAARQTQSNQPAKRRAAAGVWLVVVAAALYWLSGAHNGSLWPVSPAAPRVLLPVPILIPATLDFGSQQLHTAAGTPKEVTLRVTAADATPLSVQAATLSDPESTDFAITQDGCAGTKLGAGQTCTIGVTFNPEAQGVHSALLLVPTSLGAHPLQTTLTGAATPPPDRLNASLPAILDFGIVRAGGIATRNVRLVVTSASATPLVVQAATLSDSQSTHFTIAQDGCAGAQLGAGQACTIAISFNPVQEGAHVGLLSVPTSLGARPLQTELRGTGTPRASVQNKVPRIVEQTDLPVHVHVGGKVTEAVPIYDPPPAYPEQASKAGIEGAVQLSAVIGRDGSVRDVKIVSGDPVLAPAAVQAFSQWRYDPTKLNGQPIDDEIQVTVRFTLTRPATAP
jgi:TonB family protein